MATISIPHVNFLIKKQLASLQYSLNFTLNNQGPGSVDDVYINYDVDQKRITVDVDFTGKRESPQECAEIVLRYIKRTNWTTLLGQDLEQFKPVNVPNKVSDFLSQATIDNWNYDETECGCGARVTYEITAKDLRVVQKHLRNQFKENLKAVKNYSAVKITTNSKGSLTTIYNFINKELTYNQNILMTAQKPNPLILDNLNSLVLDSWYTPISIMNSRYTHPNQVQRTYTHTDEVLHQPIDYHSGINITVEYKKQLYEFSANLLEPVIKEKDHKNILLTDLNLSAAMFSHANMTMLKQLIKESMLRGAEIVKIKTERIKGKVRLAEYARYVEIILMAPMYDFNEIVLVRIKRTGGITITTPLGEPLNSIAVEKHIQRIENHRGDLFANDSEYAKSILLGMHSISNKHNSLIYFI
ncbi:hypothetical protein MUB04_15495 [Acinetobacter indicus]|uniref:hypothetical protein n=1 Tax=Acinetobacter TaxID=469 RepID=UPI0015D2B474|nr:MULTISPECIES: hypothetical protein [Acinetobacter]MCP0917941.1 hypothetical protein [Acinetobacter indicus]